MAKVAKADTPRDGLVPGTRLETFRIRRVMGQGGFSLIYLAEDEDTHNAVAIKEYLPKRYGQRKGTGPVTYLNEAARPSFLKGLRLFYQEAKVLAELNHPNIVTVFSCFRANNTAYLVMDLKPGKNLGRYIKKRAGDLSSQFLMTVFPPLLDALSEIHNHNHLHLDFKPSNVHLQPGGDPLLLDFGAVYHFVGSDTPNAHVITPGYSPTEQYVGGGGTVGPWTDIYAVGACMRSCIEGKPPPKATERAKDDTLVPVQKLYREQYPLHLLQAIDWAMSVKQKDRPQSAQELRQAMTQERVAPVLSA